LDIALGIGGLPRGRIVEIYGPEASGKTTLTLHAIAEAQKQGGVCAFVDAEHALDVSYARKLGVRTDDLLISQRTPASKLSKSPTAGSLRRNRPPRRRLSRCSRSSRRNRRRMGDSHMGLQARLILKRFVTHRKHHRSKTLVIFINQIRMKIGVMFGNPETTTGGNALKFYSSVRLDIRRIQAIKTAKMSSAIALA